MVNYNPRPYFEYDDESGNAICVVFYKDMTFFGGANCSPEDEDMKSERTGCEIASHRAYVKYFKYIRDNELKPALTALNHYYNVIKQSKKFNEKSYENKMLQRQIRLTENELATVNQEIALEERILKDYISGKEKLYQKIRKNRIGQD